MENAKIYNKILKIPTYETSAPCRLPMFLDKRVYQGTSGKVYPYQITEKISDTITEKEYNAILMENEYLLVVILPELGGQIHRIFDKVNSCDAVYYNNEIKPGFVGLTGPWVAGGIEFGFPQLHRNSTFEKADYFIKNNSDGSVTAYISDIDKISQLKSALKFTLYPGKAYLEAKGALYNPTEITKTFSCWTNSVIEADDSTQIVFPPDVNEVMNYYRQSVSKYPIATGEYYKADYGEGVDISKFKNIQVPSSLMACSSEFDFIGSYNHNHNLGFVQISDYHTAPGKMCWTWGNSNFGDMWYKNLTDGSGKYINISSGIFTKNQPDLEFLDPYEEKQFTQYFIPYKNAGVIKNASSDAAVNLEIKNNIAKVSVYLTSKSEVTITLKGRLKEYLREKKVLSPEMVYENSVDIGEEIYSGLKLTVKDENGKVLITYSPKEQFKEKLPKPITKPKEPEDIASLEELYLTAVYIEQQNHAICSPVPYYEEGLRRDPDDIRLNNGYGKILYNMGLFSESEKYFNAAIQKLNIFNSNPLYCEPYYNLGLSLKEQGKYDQAYDAFYKSICSNSIKERGFYQLACIASINGDFEEALDFITKSVTKGYHNLKSRNLQTTLMRLSNMNEQAEKFARETLEIDPLSHAARYELYLLTKDFGVLNTLTTIMQNDVQSYINLSICYSEAGLYDEAAKVLALISQADRRMLHYYTAYYSDSMVELDIAQNCLDLYDFPNRLHDIKVLEYAIKNNPSDARAPYDLANLLYDKGQWKKAIELWELSVKIENDHPETYRNLALAYFNKLHDSKKALQLMEKAARLAPDDARIFYELDCLYKETNYPIMKRANAMLDKMNLTSSRDDLYIECITLINILGHHERALKMLNSHNFHPWEGMEGKVSRQYKKAHIGMAIKAMKANDTEEASAHLNAALEYPENFGEGKLPFASDNDIYFLMGCNFEHTDKITSIEYFKRALEGNTSMDMAVYYNDTPPEMYFYRAMAYLKLGDNKHAKKLCNQMIDYAYENLDNDVESDYFAVSRPEFLVFDSDMNTKNKVHCMYMSALGYIGLGNKDEAAVYIDNGLNLDNSHQGLLELKNYFISENIKPQPKEMKRNFVWRK